MFDDEERAPSTQDAFPRLLDRLSIEALEAYIRDLETEIARVRTEIARKQRLHREADSVFGNGS